jgi:cytochrome o ubiquinol oxidase subunit 2
MKRLLAAASCICLAALAGCKQGVLDPKGPIAFAELQLLVDSTGIMLAIVVPTIIATLGVAFWFRASNQRARYRPDFEHSGRIELLVWAIPIMTVFLVGGVAWVASHDLDPKRPIESSAKPLRVQVISLDWKWLFIYPDDGVATINQLTIPVSRPVIFELTGSGVMNSFFVPQLGSQMYTMAGMVTNLNLRADHEGTYRGLSAEFSGDGFADMQFTVDVVNDGDYAKWLAGVHAAGRSLDTDTYNELAKPGTSVIPITYGTVASNFFDGVVNAAAAECRGQKQ